MRVEGRRTTYQQGLQKNVIRRPPNATVLVQGRARAREDGAGVACMCGLGARNAQGRARRAALLRMNA